MIISSCKKVVILMMHGYGSYSSGACQSSTIQLILLDLKTSTTSLGPLGFDMILARCSIITLEELKVHESPAAQF
jgi:hypothetical protein